jgi:hypothetical protein
MKHIVELKVAVLGYDTKEEAERDLRAHVAHGLAGAEVTVLDRVMKDTKNLPPEVLIAAEFGYKACEKGQNIQMMLSKLNEVWKG